MTRHLRTFVCAIALISCASVASAQTVQPSAPGQPGRPQRAPDTDQTVDVARGTRLSIDNFAGEVVLRTWNRDALRVVARHSSRTKVLIRTRNGVASIDAQGSMGPASVDYEVTAPSWMAVKIDGTFNYVSIEGTQAEVTASTVRGDIAIKGGTGFVIAKSVEGQVTVDGAKGRLNVESVNEGVSLANCSGDIVVTTTNGDISMTNVSATSAEATTVNGGITFDGTISGGRYRMATHNGNIVVAIPETSNATFSVRTYNGSFNTAFPLKGGNTADARRGRRVIYTLGSGEAEVELETFSGGIRIARPGSIKSRQGRE
jgi:DUF4097 and DUF4098 domain-containing protein YvlB